MVKRFLILSCAIISFLMAQSGYKVVIDPYTISAVAQNLASQKAVESLHNQRLDTIASKQQKIEQFTTTMATIAEVYKISMQNIKGFGPESRIYVEIGLTSYDIVQRVPRVIKKISDAKLSAQLTCIKELTDLSAKTHQLVGDFVNIVNNAKVENPLKGGTAEKKDDGYNFLDRNDRLQVANRIYTDLLEIRYKLEVVEMMAGYATWDNFFLTIDPEGWASIMSGKNRVNHIISSWNGLF